MGSAEIEALKLTKNELESRLEQLVEENAKKEEIINELNEKFGQLQERYENLETSTSTDIKVLSAMNTELESSLKELTEENKGQEAKIDELEDRCEQIQEQFENLKHS